ncbi:hypothetical protein [Bacillus sp. Cr_A10]|uniref:hypothetical protein n=1 Tax=Bacillus sp. Cr_A10 TaxID=3033993 RepID=UPI0023DBECCB|nr:hypothetical protein [Bacillus sp. Cr_A10]MDF2066454.1 hypothetical protein [Bacillus sp. Cr_A10]
MKGVFHLKSNILIFVFLTSLLFITGYTLSNSVQTYDTNNENVISIVDEKVLKIDDSEEEFSYLTDLSEEELKSYKLFTQEYDTNYIKGFSPEKIMLIYIHSAVIDDIEAIYSLVYIDGELLDFDTFKKIYYQNLNISNLEMALDFRYYDTIKIKQEDSNGLLVELTVSYGRFTASTLMELKKENDIWKIVLPHSFKK